MERGEHDRTGIGRGQRLERGRGTVGTVRTEHGGVAKGGGRQLRVERIRRQAPPLAVKGEQPAADVVAGLA